MTEKRDKTYFLLTQYFGRLRFNLLSTICRVLSPKSRTKHISIRHVNLQRNFLPTTFAHKPVLSNAKFAVLIMFTFFWPRASLLF